MTKQHPETISQLKKISLPPHGGDFAWSRNLHNRRWNGAAMTQRALGLHRSPIIRNPIGSRST
jgi:hypothetical protein